ncbi:MULTISPECIES: hypothetical protein [unclassified Streptomyces]|uniref:hypothetical protein n=1 Tax=unclassified Streptomyces TaxID=2593676 RepID=UPI0036A4DBDE
MSPWCASRTGRRRSGVRPEAAAVLRRVVRRGIVLGLGALWWWAVLRIAFGHGAGALEGAVAIGGWGLSVLPVHCVPEGRAAGAVAAGRWTAAWRGESATGAASTLCPAGVGSSLPDVAGLDAGAADLGDPDADPADPDAGAADVEDGRS